MAIEGKVTPERGFAAFMTGVLDGYVKGRGLQMAQGQERRSNEAHAMELRLNDLAARKANAEYAEYIANSGQRRRAAEALIGAANRQYQPDPVELQEAKLETARANADAAAARADYEEARAEMQADLKRLTGIIEELRRQTAGEVGEFDAGEGVDTRDMPALEPGEQGSVAPGPVRGTVPGGKRVLTGPPQQGSIMEEEEADPMVAGGRGKAILPPGAEGTKSTRTIPIQPSEVKKALEADDVQVAVDQLVKGGGTPFGAAREKQKREDPLGYTNSVEQEIDRHEKAYRDIYRKYNAPGANLRERMLQIFTDPRERAWQTPLDTDAAASRAVGEFSLAALLANDQRNPLRTYLSMDAANNGDVARYSGKLLNGAMDDVFGASAQNLRFMDDADYTLRQIVEALYDDSMSANGNAQLGFTQGLDLRGTMNTDHELMQLLGTYWEPVRAMDRRDEMRKERFPGQYRNPMLNRPGRE